MHGPTGLERCAGRCWEHAREAASVSGKHWVGVKEGLVKGWQARSLHVHCHAGPVHQGCCQVDIYNKGRLLLSAVARLLRAMDRF